MKAQDLTEHLLSLPHCTRALKLEFRELFQPQTIEKGQLLISPHLYHRSVHFLAEGMLRTYSNESIPPVTTQLHLPGSYILQQGMYLNSPANEYTEAITEATLHTVDYPQLERFLSSSPQAIRLLLSILEKRYINLGRQNILLKIPSASARYQTAMEFFGKDFFAIPKHIIGSYLAISLKHLGRIAGANLRSRL